jgi:hypothetical protein
MSRLKWSSALAAIKLQIKIRGQLTDTVDAADSLGTSR